ncbi:VOC family protein [Actinomadura latina]|uniref:VOC family protein n=1 Tax=Actinomadura latina TaxID=163603 RepID=UPI000A639B9A|nr:VOC family protein [Actinomadura latina]
MTRKNTEFELRGVNHLALVSSDMKRTVDFYEGVLGMPLIKTIELPMGWGQHFFFDCGGGNALAFFWFPDAPEPCGVSCGPSTSRTPTGSWWSSRRGRGS